VGADGSVGPWSVPFGFNMRWADVPRPLPAPPGLVRWTNVDGATAYQVWYVEANTTFKTQTNVADEREDYTFHTDPSCTGAVHWRIRAIRSLYGAGTARNGLPETSFGPWSPAYPATNTPLPDGPLTTAETISDTTSPAAHHLMPAFVYRGDAG